MYIYIFIYLLKLKHIPVYIDSRISATKTCDLDLNYQRWPLAPVNAGIETKDGNDTYDTSTINSISGLYHINSIIF